ncbi:MAG: metallophosphoesterase family protein [Verrucomicrobiales bacterium]|nr:metallophosphoesterase family protein [Verrucomicrobiales bacterium]
MGRIGLISDTHNHLDPAVLKAFRGVDQILHAGDVGARHILAALESIAPVTVVSGNTDYDPDWRETEVAEAAGLKILLRHIVDPYALTRELRGWLDRVRPHIVLFGHTHQRCQAWVNNVLFLNPGSPSRPRMGEPPGVALLDGNAEKFHVEFVNL